MSVPGYPNRKKGIIMSELSIDELQAETGELLPERETLTTGVTLTNYGAATAVQFFTYKSSETAVLVQSNAVGSFNGFGHHH